MRRATLGRIENLTKQQVSATLAYDLSLPMCKVFRFETPMQ
jgi:hypothetical protein